MAAELMITVIMALLMAWAFSNRLQAQGPEAYVSMAGGTMRGPLALPAGPTAPNQAADQHYVNSGPVVKAGGVPAGITYATTALNWITTISTSLAGGSQVSVTLIPCPVGIDTTSGAGYQVLLSGGGNSEAVSVVTAAGGCTSGAASGKITFTPFHSYAAGYTIGSASSGIQEALNAACGVNATLYKNGQCNVTIPANGPDSSVNTYNVFGTIYLHSNQSVLNGQGTTLNCLGRGACLQVGDLRNSNNFTDTTVTGLSFRSPANLSSNAAFAGVAISQTQRISQVVTITTATANGFRVGDMVTILFTDTSSYWGDATITAVQSPTTFQYTHSGADIAAQASPGVVALAYVAVLDNAMNTHLTDISYDKVGEVGHFNNFFDLWDDENVTIDHFNNQAISLNHNANWTGSFVFSAGNQSMQVAPVITLRDSTITANSSNGVTDYNSNGLYVENTVLQATGLWQVYSSNSTGNYQGAYLKNVYSESNLTLNPLSPPRSPFPGLGVAGLIAGRSTGAATFTIDGSGGLSGALPTGGTGSTPYVYFVVANDITANMATSPLPILYWKSTGSDSIPVRWPRVANGADVITYDLIRANVFPYNGGCPGGSHGTCGSVVTSLSQASACSGTLVCSYTDTGSSATSAYTVKLGKYNGNFAFWPGAIVSVNHSVSLDHEQYATGVGLGGDFTQVTNVCQQGGQAAAGGVTSCLTSRIDSGPNQTATLLGDNGTSSNDQNSAVTGRLNIITPPGAYWQAHQIITLMDSNPGSTTSTSGYRRPASVTDAWIGTDAPHNTPLSTTMLAIGAGQSITQYIANIGSSGTYPFGGAGWLERLTSKQKTFAVPVKINEGSSFTLGDGSPLSQMKIYSIDNIPASPVPPQRCVDVIGKAKGLTKSDLIASITPPGRLGNLSLNAYPADEGTVILHFCNASVSEVVTPRGAYSFLAVR